MAQLAELQSQMTGLMHGYEESKRTAATVKSLESQVSRIAGPLEKILNAIQIDDNLCLVPQNRRIEGPSQGPSQDVSRSVSQETSFPSDLYVNIPMDEDELLSSSVPGTVTTPSDQQEDVRMDEAALPALQPTAALIPAPVHPPAVAPAPLPPVSAFEPASADSMPPPPPVVNLIPPTPHGSQDEAAASVTTQADPVPAPPTTKLQPTQTRPANRVRRGRSRTPATGAAEGSASQLAIPEGRTTRSQSRSKTPI